MMRERVDVQPPRRANCAGTKTSCRGFKRRAPLPRAETVWIK
jgi:hypothetical protein